MKVHALVHICVFLVKCRKAGMLDMGRFLKGWNSDPGAPLVAVGEAETGMSSWHGRNVTGAAREGGESDEK